jgi:hypothetical protein
MKPNARAKCGLNATPSSGANGWNHGGRWSQTNDRDPDGGGGKQAGARPNEVFARGAARRAE